MSSSPRGYVKKYVFAEWPCYSFFAEEIQEREFVTQFSKSVKKSLDEFKFKIFYTFR